MKTVGQRKAATGMEAADRLQKLAHELRQGRPFIPRGVYRFRTFQEANEWSLKMQARAGSGRKKESAR